MCILHTLTLLPVFTFFQITSLLTSQQQHTSQLPSTITTTAAHVNTMAESSKKRSPDVQDNEATVDPHNQIVHVPNNLEERVKFINTEKKTVAKLCVASKTGVLDPNTALTEAKAWLLRLELFMQWLETSVEMTPTLKKRTQIDTALQLIFDNPKFHFKETTRERARLLYERWQAQNWGKGEVVDESSEDDTATSEDNAAGSSKRRKSSTDGGTAKGIPVSKLGTTVRPPPANYPIFGVEGIMHGVALKIGAHRKDYILDSRYQKRDAKVYGHNGLQVGDWWPVQLLALFNGAHGARMGGIAGNAETGAYSVVTAGGPYEELDQDKGDVLFYSGSRSHDNTDPKKPFPSSNATMALKASERLGKPVRVLRAAGFSSSKSGGATLRPTVGIRYDGLYRVVGTQLKTNANGGLYEQFKLERLAGQRPLSDFIKSRPTAKEVRDFDRREDGY
jgi:hypothetical protein